MLIVFILGEFGIVYRALLTIREKKEMTIIPVAVKTLKSLFYYYNYHNY